MDYKSHWNKVYNNKVDEELGWFESDPKMTWKLIEACQLDKHARILNVGAGTSRLIDLLIENGFDNTIANDLSDSALSKLQKHILDTFQVHLECIVDDLTAPEKLTKIAPVNLWIDRAVLHFFLRPEEQDSYFNLIKTLVASKGFVIIAVFSLDGADTCSNLPLHRYDAHMLKEKLGSEFQLLSSFNHTFITPSGAERPYIYTLFQRN